MVEGRQIADRRYLSEGSMAVLSPIGVAGEPIWR
jgi:hypothetical protein